MIHHPMDTPLVIEADGKTLIKPTGFKLLQDETSGAIIFVIEGETVGVLEDLDGENTEEGQWREQEARSLG